MKYEACYLPGDGGPKDPSKGGFKTREEAWEYVESQRCDMCLEDIENHGDDAIIRCDAEWGVHEETVKHKFWNIYYKILYKLKKK